MCLYITERCKFCVTVPAPSISTLKMSPVISRLGEREMTWSIVTSTRIEAVSLGPLLEE